MISFFKNKIYVSALFFFILAVDICVKFSADPLPARFLTKTALLSILLYFFMVNKKEKHVKDKFFYIGFLFFWIGDLVLLLYENPILYIAGMSLFIIGKLFYTIRFSHQKDFEMSSLMPFFVVVFIYIVVIVLFVYDNLKDFFIPIIIYIFASMLLGLFAFLRKDSVNRKSFYLIMIAVIIGAGSDSTAVLQSFYDSELPYHQILVMLFYALFQYLIILGLLEEKEIKHKDLSTKTASF
ncbi:lysoplasmalogenase family protein [Olleya namhaensis]|uniref:lysoplasmalogenase family protein n=1 Tax=Olleya namhaensis TaxID=1144750 RepID=UPI00248F5F7D|nr:lysoplasmalogenase family protein [Olleya namhaensis]